MIHYVRGRRYRFDLKRHVFLIIVKAYYDRWGTHEQYPSWLWL